MAAATLGKLTGYSLNKLVQNSTKRYLVARLKFVEFQNLVHVCIVRPKF